MGIELSRYDITRAYMVFGGIPYYLSYFRRGLSLERNIDVILFGRKPRLNDEFNRLFGAIFKNADDCKKIIRLLASRHSGFTREEIAQQTGLPLGGGLTATLASLATWCVKGDDGHEGVQIDMLIFRKDNVVNLCEMKFAYAPYTIDKDEDLRLRKRIEALKATLSPKQTVHLTMVTTFGVAQGKYSGIVQKQITLDDLFE